MRNTHEARKAAHREAEHDHGVEHPDIHAKLQSIGSYYAEEISRERLTFDAPSILVQSIVVQKPLRLYSRTPLERTS